MSYSKKPNFNLFNSMENNTTWGSDNITFAGTVKNPPP